MKLNKIYYVVLNKILKKTFKFWERLGFHIIPNHYHEPIPDKRTLKDDLWLKHSKLFGVNLNEKTIGSFITFYF